MTWPAPSWNAKGSPRSQEASNWRPFAYDTPTYWTCTFWPGCAAGPLPTFRSLISSFLGGLPLGTLTSGLVGAGVAAGAGVELASFSESEPQPPSARAAQARAGTIERLRSGMAPQGRRCSAGPRGGARGEAGGVLGGGQRGCGGGSRVAEALHGLHHGQAARAAIAVDVVGGRTGGEAAVGAAQVGHRLCSLTPLPERYKPGGQLG